MGTSLLLSGSAFLLCEMGELNPVLRKFFSMWSKRSPLPHYPALPYPCATMAALLAPQPSPESSCFTVQLGFTLPAAEVGGCGTCPPGVWSRQADQFIGNPPITLVQFREPLSLPSSVPKVHTERPAVGSSPVGPRCPCSPWRGCWWLAVCLHRVRHSLCGGTGRGRGGHSQH